VGVASSVLTPHSYDWLSASDVHAFVLCQCKVTILRWMVSLNAFQRYPEDELSFIYIQGQYTLGESINVASLGIYGTLVSQPNKHINFNTLCAFTHLPLNPLTAISCTTVGTFA
jgi:hypothetical protein